MRIGARGAGMALASASLILAAAVPAVAQSPSAPAAGPRRLAGQRDAQGRQHVHAEAEHRRQAAPTAGDINYVVLVPVARASRCSRPVPGGLQHRPSRRPRRSCPASRGSIIAPRQMPLASTFPSSSPRSRRSWIPTPSTACPSSRLTRTRSPSITNQAMAAGIPVFTVGVTVERQRAHQLHADPEPRGRPGREDRASLDEGHRQGPQGLRCLRWRPDVLLGSGPDEVLPRDASRPPSRTPPSSTTRPAP